MSTLGHENFSFIQREMHRLETNVERTSKKPSYIKKTVKMVCIWVCVSDYLLTQKTSYQLICQMQQQTRWAVLCRWLEGSDSISGCNGVARFEPVRLTLPPPGTGSDRPVDEVDEPLDDGRGVREPLDGVRLRGTGVTDFGVGWTGIRLDTVVPGLVAVAELILMAST